ncbi:MAG: AAA family ATPase [Sphingobium sp.]|nr:AAA family ATPase [Sphingobium sp.]
MYVKHYKLTGRPFQLTPDPRFYFESATHRKAMSYLGYGLAQGEGFIVITGDIGAGKTTLVAHLMATIDPKRLAAVKIAASEMDGDTALRLAAHAFGIETDGVDKAQVLSRLEAFMHQQARAGRRSLLIIDEAQTLGFDALEAMRMLSNFQLGGQSLVQIFLLGQPEFREAVAGSPELEQLRQRVIASHHLEPMLPHEVQPYVEHRLKLVGWTGNPRFDPDALERLADVSRGVPRVLNTLAQNAMQLAADQDKDAIDLAIVEAACEARETVLAASPPSAEAPAVKVSAEEHRQSIRAAVHSLRAAAGEARAAEMPSEDGDDRLAAIEARLARLEGRMDEHDEMLERILAKMIALVEDDEDGADIAPCAA